MTATKEDTAQQGRNGYKWVDPRHRADRAHHRLHRLLGHQRAHPVRLQDYHLTAATAGLASAAMHAGPIVSMLVLGSAIDRYGERWVVALTMMAMGIASLGAALLHPNYPLLLVFILAMGAFYGSILPVASVPSPAGSNPACRAWQRESASPGCHWGRRWPG